MTGHYGNISISTAGNQIRDAKGMKADIEIDDVRLSTPATRRAPSGVGCHHHLVLRRHQGDDSEVHPARRELRQRGEDEPVRRHHRTSGRAGQHRRQADGRRPRHRARGSETHRPRLHAATRGGAACARLVQHAAHQGVSAGHSCRQRRGHRHGCGRQVLHPKRHHSRRPTRIPASPDCSPPWVRQFSRGARTIRRARRGSPTARAWSHRRRALRARRQRCGCRRWP